MNPVDLARREIGRALAGVRTAFRGVVSNFRHRGPEPILIQGTGLAGEPLQDMEMYQQVGFVSGPPAGTKKILLPLGGRTVHTVIIATEFGQYRVEVAPGEVALYHASEPDCWIHLKAGRVIAARCARYEVVADEEVKFVTQNFKVEAAAGASVTTPTLTTSHDLKVGGDATIRDSQDNRYTLGEFVEKYNRHDHVEHDAGGPTDPPATEDQIT
ncbi:phage baseplate assembly protein [Azonexus sp. R2A61]|uniref:phage baseplate assembly protein domain-containing protein n=1 Tax=Azonexus sp. R2A61 TaxID=2744443 RepID=UPI001F3C25AB|nr:phage baseplate assembly protein [Azonexus sp. R2A61]